MVDSVTHSRWIAVAFASLGLGLPARAQCFNLDFGDGFGTPSSSYSAASGQAGVWQTLNPVNGAVVGLTDVAGGSPGATVQFAWGAFGTSGVSAVDLAPTGDDEALVDDWWWHNSQDLSTLFQVRFKGLEPGTYRVFCYAWWGNTGFKRTVVQVPRGGHVSTVCGMGAWLGQHVLAVAAGTDGSYVTDALATFDGQLRIDFQSISFPSAVNGIQLVKLDACPNAVYAAYCDQGVVDGCDPVILASGRPSASNTDDFQVELVAASVNREGFFYFSTQGPVSLPWKGGVSTQCVQPPVQRTTLMPSGSSGPCTGYYALEFNDWMAQHPLKAPPAGSTVQMQLVSYKPAGPSASARLLDAIEFDVGP